MQHLIRELLDIDKRGRDLVGEAEESRTRMSEEIRRSTESIRDELGHRADVHLEHTREARERDVQARLSAAQADFDRRLAAMETIYNTHRADWVNALVQRSLGRMA